MSESRRVELISSVPSVTEKKKTEEPARIVRLTVTLAESTDVSCPEFSFVELVKNATGTSNDLAELDPDDPFAAQDRAEHDKMVAIAKGFEAKYSSKPGKKHKLNYRQKREIRDLVDHGDGYDETDTFIDNTEAYDEFVPSCLTTKHGGFYINFGQLDFREVSDDLHDGFHRKKRIKRRRVISDSEANDSEKKDVKKKDGGVRENGKEERTIKKGKKLSNGLVKKHKRAVVLVKPSQLAERMQAMHTSSTAIRGQQQDTAATCEPVQNAVTQGSDAEQQLFSPPKTGVMTGSGDGIAVGRGVVSSCSIESAIDSVISQARAKVDTASDLPETLSPELLESVNALKDAAAKLQATGSRLFTAEVNQILLQIETRTRCLPHGTRSAVFGHLAKVMSCEKEMLIKRAKRMVLAQLDEKLRQPIALLKDAFELLDCLSPAVQSAMPALVERHMSDVNATEQLRRERQLDSRDAGRRDLGGPTTDSDDNGTDENHDMAATTAGSTGEKMKRIVAPRKKFEWTPAIRLLLADIVKIKMEHYEMSKVRSQSAEEYLKAFFEAELKPIWPQGWIQARMLFKESRAAHYKWTTTQPKSKKVLLTGSSGMRTATSDAQNGVALTSNVANSDSQRRSPCGSVAAKPLCDVISIDDDYHLPQLFAEPLTDAAMKASMAHISPLRNATPGAVRTSELGLSVLAANGTIEHRRASMDTALSNTAVVSGDYRPQHSTTSRPGRDGIKLHTDTARMISLLKKPDAVAVESKPDVQGLAQSPSFVEKFNEFLSHGSSERKVAPVAAVVSPHVGFQSDELERMARVLPTSPTSEARLSQFSPVKSGALSAPSTDCARVSVLPSTELRRDSFPPYVTSASKRSTAVVAPSLSRTRPVQPNSASSVHSAASSLLQYPSLSGSGIQRLMAPFSTMGSTAARSEVTDRNVRQHASSLLTSRSSGSLSLLASSCAASSGISYSLASSDFMPASRASAGSTTASRPATGLSASSSAGSQQQQEALYRELTHRYVNRSLLRGSSDLAAMYSPYVTQSQTSGANAALTTASHTAFTSPPSRTFRETMAPYQLYSEPSRPLQSTTASYPFISPSASAVSSQRKSLQNAATNYGSNRNVSSSQMPASTSVSILQSVVLHGEHQC